MRQRRDEAYVLRTHALGEADLIVSLFTLQHGKVRGVARSARRSRRRFGGLLEPLTHVRVAWTERPGSELVVIDALDEERSFAAMQSDPVVQAACAVLCEVGEAVSREEQPDPASFRLLGAILRALEAGTDALLAVRYFEYWTLRIHGLLPDVDLCQRCGRELGPQAGRRVGPAGQVQCRRCDRETGLAGRRLGSAERAFLAAARARPPEALDVDPRVARPDGALAGLLRGALESYAERRFHSYRHLTAAEEPPC